MKKWRLFLEVNIKDLKTRRKNKENQNIQHVSIHKPKGGKSRKQRKSIKKKQRIIYS
jgi:hypothetical protein